jgi:hypothetical protein
MQLNEFFEPNPLIAETKMVWARRGQKVVRKFRCTFGRRKGRIVANMSQCSAPLDIKKRFTLKRTKARMGSRIQRKIQRTKRVNPTSKRVARLNKIGKK